MSDAYNPKEIISATETIIPFLFISSMAKSIIPDKLESLAFVKDKNIEYENAADQDDLKRFD